MALFVCLLVESGCHFRGRVGVKVNVIRPHFIVAKCHKYQARKMISNLLRGLRCKRPSEPYGSENKILDLRKSPT